MKPVKSLSEWIEREKSGEEQDWAYDPRPQIERLLAERDRLRQALEEIERASGYAHPPDRAIGYIRKIARGALEAVPE